MKQCCIISAPVDTYSGYGARSRDFIKAIYDLKKDDWEISILPQRWGSTPWGYIKDHLDQWQWMEKIFLRSASLKTQPDIWIQITVPNEFQPVGKYNIGVTAGIETTMCHPNWLDGCNRMNLVLTSSEHAKKVFESSQFEMRDQSGNIQRKVKLEKPVKVLFEGVDTDKYRAIDNNQEKTEVVKSLDDIKESFCFLIVGHWMQGALGEDRKNIGLTLKTFLESFKDKKNKPAIIMKVSSGGASIMDRDQILYRINEIKSQVSKDHKDLPNVYLLHGEIEDEDMNNLYNHEKVKAMISLTKGEGFGRPLLEFSVTKKPIIASNWSGQTDFLNEEFCCLINGEVKQIHNSAVVQEVLIPESAWFQFNIADAKKAMKDVYENYDKYLVGAKRQAHRSKNEFSYNNMKDLLDHYLNEIPKQVSFKLPELKLPELKRMELPKLKKVEI